MEVEDEDLSADVPPSPSKTLFNDEEWEAMAKPRKTKKKGEDGEPVIAYDHYMLLALEERYLATEKQIKDGACQGKIGVGNVGSVRGGRSVLRELLAAARGICGAGLVLFTKPDRASCSIRLDPAVASFPLAQLQRAE